MADEEKQLIETVDEDGNVINFELYDIVEVEGQEYALLIPAEANGDVDEEEVVLMKLYQEGEDYVFESIDDDEEFNRVAEYIESMDVEEEE